MGNSTRKHGENYKTLTAEILAKCRNITAFKDEDILYEHRRFFSVTQSGHLKRPKMGQLFDKFLPEAEPERSKALYDCVFAAIDRNHDGSIDFLEYLMSVKFFESKLPVEKAAFIFRIMDTNGDNTITIEELQHILKRLHHYHESINKSNVTNIIQNGSKPAASILFEKLDKDKSGSIALSEFVEGWLRDETIRTLFDF